MTEERQLIPVGTYTGEITEYGVYEQNDKEYVEVTIALPDMETHRSARIWLTEKALDTGWPERKLKALGCNFDFRPGHLVLTAKEATMNCTHRMWENEERENWDIAIPGMVKTEPATDKVKRLNAMFKKQRDESVPKRNARDEAWEALEKASEDKSVEEKVKIFAQLAKQIGGDKLEADMTDAEWDQVKDAAGSPF